VPTSVLSFSKIQTTRKIKKPRKEKWEVRTWRRETSCIDAKSMYCGRRGRQPGGYRIDIEPEHITDAVGLDERRAAAHERVGDDPAGTPSRHRIVHEK